MKNPKIAVILAGRRASGDVIEAETGHHKAFLEFDGTSAITRVLKALKGVTSIKEAWIIAPEDLSKEFSEIDIEGIITSVLPAADGPSQSLLNVFQQVSKGDSLLVTTCDLPLLTTEIVSTFVNGIADDVDVAAGVVTRQVYEAAYPNTRRTYIKFRDISFSGANLFYFDPIAADPLMQFWRQLEDNRKQPLKMAAQIGVLTGLKYSLGMLTKSDAVQAIIGKTGVRAGFVELPEAKAAIDVDKMEDIATVREIFEAKKEKP